MLSNIVLDELDQELARRGLAFCRFADDCNIFVKTPKAAERVMKNVSGTIEKRMKRVVNRDKSQVSWTNRKAGEISFGNWSNAAYRVTRRPVQCSPTRAAGPCRTPGRLIKRIRQAGSWERWVWSSDPTNSYRIGLMFNSGQDLREEPCTDPYARFCGQTGAAAPSDPITDRWFTSGHPYQVVAVRLALQ